MTIEQLLEQSRGLPKKEIVIGDGRTFAYYTPAEIFTNPDLVRAVKSQDFALVEAELIRDYSRDNLNPEYREKTQQEIDECYISYPIRDLMVVEVQGKFTIEMDDSVEIAVDQVQILERVLKFPHE